MAAISIVRSLEVLSAQQRFDAEAYAPELRLLERALKGSPRLGDSEIANVSHPTEIPREYVECSDALPFLLAGNIKPILPDLSDLVCIPRAVAREIPSNRMARQDIPDELLPRFRQAHHVDSPPLPPLPSSGPCQVRSL
jgi:hypothetical protein